MFEVRTPQKRIKKLDEISTVRVRLRKLNTSFKPNTQTHEHKLRSNFHLIFFFFFSPIHLLKCNTNFVCTRMQQHGFNLPKYNNNNEKIAYTKFMAFAPLYHTLRWRRGDVNKFIFPFHCEIQTKLVPHTPNTHTVVIDYPKDESGISSTGRFEMVFEKDFSWIENGLLPYRFSHESHW